MGVVVVLVIVIVVLCLLYKNKSRMVNGGGPLAEDFPLFLC